MMNSLFLKQPQKTFCSYVLGKFLAQYGVWLLFSSMALAANKPQGPINLEADHGTFDLKAKAHHFSGNIHLTQADFSVKSDQAWVTGEPGKQIVRATGSPVRVVWPTEHIQAHALRVEYNQATGDLDLNGNVHLDQGGNFLEGQHVRYSLITRAAQADGGQTANGQGGRVKMHWVPAESGTNPFKQSDTSGAGSSKE